MPPTQSAEFEKLQEHDHVSIDDEILELNSSQQQNNNSNHSKTNMNHVMLTHAAVLTQHLHVRPFRPSLTTTTGRRVTMTAPYSNHLLRKSAGLRVLRLTLARLRAPRRPQAAHDYGTDRTYDHATNDNLCNHTVMRTTARGVQQTLRHLYGYLTTRTKQWYDGRYDDYIYDGTMLQYRRCNVFLVLLAFPLLP